MEWYREVNFILQSSYLVLHLLFMVWLIGKRRPTPLWNWYIASAAAIWIWVLGRFMETIVYIFLPGDNAAYVFAANFQYIGNTTAVYAYLIWNMYLAGYDRAASSLLLRASLFLGPLTTCLLVFSNHSHHLIYRKLDMGERVVHGSLFVFCVLSAYLIILAGYLLSVRYAVRAGQDVMKRIFMFSVFPGLPAVAAMVRCITGIDKLDYTPVFMAVSFYFQYLIVFRYNYTSILSSSVQSVIKQSSHPIWLYSSASGEFVYRNAVAGLLFTGLEHDLRTALSSPEPGEKVQGKIFIPEDILLNGKYLQVDVSHIPQSTLFIIIASDVTDVRAQQKKLEQKVLDLEAVILDLEDQNRNYDAYLEILYETEGLREKQALIAAMDKMLPALFHQMADNFQAAKDHPEKADEILHVNIQLAQSSIISIRKTVARLRDGC